MKIRDGIQVSIGNASIEMCVGTVEVLLWLVLFLHFGIVYF